MNVSGQGTGRPATASAAAMNPAAPFRHLAIVLATALLAGCAGSAGGSPKLSPLSLADVTPALRTAGIAVVEVQDNLNPRDGAWKCLPGSLSLARVLPQPAGTTARPGDKPGIEILIFPSDAARVAAQAAIDANGQVKAQGCAAMVDWIGTPHVVGARNVILFIATDDPAEVSAVRAAATSLGR